MGAPACASKRSHALLSLFDLPHGYAFGQDRLSLADAQYVPCPVRQRDRRAGMQEQLHARKHAKGIIRVLGLVAGSGEIANRQQAIHRGLGRDVVLQHPARCLPRIDQRDGELGWRRCRLLLAADQGQRTLKAELARLKAEVKDDDQYALKQPGGSVDGPFNSKPRTPGAQARARAARP